MRRLVRHVTRRKTAEPLAAMKLGNTQWVAMGASIVIAAAGIGGAALFYSPRKRFNPATAAKSFRPMYDLFVHKWYFDEMYEAALVRPTMALSRFVSRFDKSTVDGVVNLSAGVAVGVSKFEGLFDKIAVDGVVKLVGGLVYVLGDIGRSLQTGRLRSYLGFLAFAVVALFAGVFYWITRPI